MKWCVLRKVAYRLPRKSRLVWAFMLAQQEGLSLLFVPKPGDNRSHGLVIAVENPSAGFFEDVAGNRFPLETEDLERISNRLKSLGDNLTNIEFWKLFNLEED